MRFGLSLDMTRDNTAPLGWATDSAGWRQRVCRIVGRLLYSHPDLNLRCDSHVEKHSDYPRSLMRSLGVAAAGGSLLRFNFG